MVDWTAALSGVSTAIQITKDLKALDNSMSDAVHRAQLVTLMEQLSDVRMQMLDAREEARELADKIKAYQSIEIDLTRLTQVDGFYFDKFEDGKPKGTAYCRFCIERKAGLFHTQATDYRHIDYVCPNCKTQYPLVPSFPWDHIG